MENKNILEQENSRKQGDVGLGYAIAYFTKMGYTVSIPLTDNQKYDLIFEENNELKKVSIKTSRQWNKLKKYLKVTLKTSGGNKSGHKIIYFNKNEVDYLFILTLNGLYLIPSSDVNQKSTLTLTEKYDKYIVQLGVFPAGAL